MDGLRRALGDRSLAVVPPHITLVPPVNVRVEEVPAALAVLRRAAAGRLGPLRLHLGPPATFWPDSAVIYLPVTGEDVPAADLRALHDGVLCGPLDRPERWPWVPHVTLTDRATPGQLEDAPACLGGYEADVVIERVVLMEERERRWSARADARLGPPVVLGRGGLELEVHEGAVVGPDAHALLAGLGEPVAPVALHAPDAVVLTGVRSGQAIAVALAWPDGPLGSPLGVLVGVAQAHQGMGVGRALLSQLEAAVRRRGWTGAGARGYGPPGFYQRNSAWARPAPGTGDG